MKDLSFYGPLKYLIGTWESQGYEGKNRAPDPDREVENTRFRQIMTFDPIGVQENHEQSLYILEYTNLAWEEGDDDKPFHRELGYFCYDPDRKYIMKGFSIPRGQSVLAGGIAEADDLEFTVKALRKSTVYGISSNPFLEYEFKTVSYEALFKIHDENMFSYAENTRLQMPGREELFDHEESNILVRLS